MDTLHDKQHGSGTFVVEAGMGRRYLADLQALNGTK
jgi:hypothetical protein